MAEVLFVLFYNLICSRYGQKMICEHVWTGNFATWVDVVYINGTAEALYNGGILACQAPLGYALALVLGGILFARPMREAGYVTMLDPFQGYFQRVLSSRTSETAQRISFVAGLGCIIMAIPAALIGAIARNTDWRLTEYFPWSNGIKSAFIPVDQTSMVVPLVFQYLTPKWVSIIGLGAISAAVMSSVDSCVLSSASMFAHNIWKVTIRPHASEKEVILVLRFGIIAVGILATILALTINSVYGLWYLSADLIYVTLFPQLLCVVYFNRTNSYGCLLGFTAEIGCLGLRNKRVNRCFIVSCGTLSMQSDAGMSTPNTAGNWLPNGDGAHLNSATKGPL
ncbi:sodium:solute symporter family domain-containing protein [Ditylenchus destructor]|nr:sodium:solute symporter family domain-containing protein [Ditylenchus destructor]